MTDLMKLVTKVRGLDQFPRLLDHHPASSLLSLEEKALNIIHNPHHMSTIRVLNINVKHNDIIDKL